MDPRGVVEELAQIEGRGSCTDAERRAARLLAARLRSSGRRPRTETVWVRPQWAWIWLLHAALGIAGSVVSVESAVPALVVVAIATVSAAAQLSGRFPVLAMLWPRRATQNVVARGAGEAPVRLVVTAHYDAPRAYTAALRAGAGADAAVRRLLGGRWPHPLALLTLALAAVTGCVIARVAGAEGTLLGAIQLPPTVVCIIATALLADLAFGGASAGANANASAAAAALEIVGALDERPPRNLAVDLVLAGASDGPALGLRRHIRLHRKELRPEQVAVLHLEPCGAGRPHVWTHDGPLLALRLHPRLVELAEGLAPPHRGHGTGAPYVARQARWPAVALGGLDDRGRAPYTRTRDDDLEHLDRAAIRRSVDVALQLVARLDADLGGRAS